MLDEFKGRTAVVSGAAEGIGRALALAFADAGLNVGLLDINSEAVSTLAREIAAKGVKSAIGVCDVSLRDQVDSAASSVESALGPASLVWANAGVGSMGGVIGMPQDELDWIYSVNVNGMLNVVRRFGGPLQKLEGPRHIGLTASVSGLTAIGAYAAGYGATKFAVIGIGEALKAELEDTDIGVTILCPGLVNTRIWDAGKARPERFGGQSHLPEEVGDRWREHGMTPDWVASEAVRTVQSGGGYISPVDPHSRDDFDSRAAMIRSSFSFPPG